MKSFFSDDLDICPNCREAIEWDEVTEQFSCGCTREFCET